MRIENESMYINSILIMQIVEFFILDFSVFFFYFWHSLLLVENVNIFNSFFVMLFYKTVEHCCQETINYSLFFRAPGRSCTACLNEFEKKVASQDWNLDSSKLTKIKIPPIRFFFTSWNISKYLCPGDSTAGKWWIF